MYAYCTHPSPIGLHTCLGGASLGGLYEVRDQLYSIHQYMQYLCMHGAEFSIHTHTTAHCSLIANLKSMYV